MMIEALQRVTKDTCRVVGVVYLELVAHRAAAQDGHLGQRFLLQPLQRIAFGAEQFPYEIELRPSQGKQ